jgi:hypothetical protein
VGGGAGDGYNIIGVNGAGTNSATTLQLSNANNVTFGLNAGTITASASYAAQTVQTQPSGNIVGAGFTSTTTAGTAVVATQNSNGLSMGVPTIITNAITTAALSNHSHNFATTTTNGSQVIVATTNSAGATIAVPPFITTYVGQTTQTQPAGNIAGVGTTFAGANLSASMTMNSNGLNLSMSAAAPGGGGAINVSAGTTSGNLQTIEFSNANGVSWGLNGSTVTASVNAGGGAAETLTNYVPNQLGANTTFSSLGQNTVYFQHFIPDEYVTMSKIEMYARGSFVSSSNSQVYAQTVHYGLYSQDTGASSTRMTQIGSSSLAYSVSYNSTTAAGFTISQGAGSFTTSGTNTTMLTSISGPFHLYLPFEGSLQPDVKYAFGIRVSSATTGNTGAHRFAPLALSMMASTNMAKMYTSTVVASANSLVGDRDMGFYATTSASLPASYATSNLSQVVSRQRFYLQFEQN